MTFPTEALQQHIAIVGKTGSGKTYTAKGLVEGLLEAKRRVCILDPTGAWYGLRASADGKRAGYPVAVFGGAHADVPIAEHSGATLARILAEKNLPAIIDLSEMLIGQRHRFVTDFAEALYRENKSPLHLVIDEADEFIPQNPLPETKRLLHHIDRIIRRGRIRGFRVMMISQRPAVIHKNALTQANTLVVMRLTAPQDRKAIQAWIDGNGDAADGKRVLDSLARMQRGEGWVWAPELGVLAQEKFPRIRTFDSSRSPEDDEKVQEPARLAEVDLGEIKASFEAVEAEARTLVELKAENAKLKRDLAAAMKRAEQTGVPEADVQRRIREAAAAAKTDAGNNSRNILRDDARKALERMVVIAQRALGAGQLTKSADSAGSADKVDGSWNRHNVVIRKPERATGPISSAAGVSAPQQRILDVLAQLALYGIDTPDKAMVAAHAGVSPTSGGYFNNLGRLRALGLVDYPQGGTVALTDSGSAAANHQDRAPTLDELHESWYAILPAPQAAILRAAVGVYPKAIPKDDLADHVGVSRTSGGYFNNLGRLRTLGAIDYPQRGTVRASDILFPAGTAGGKG